MMWIFAILIVLALGGIAALTASRAGTMPAAYTDRPDAEVPADRPLGADDLRRVRFSMTVRGYRMSEVDALLERLAREASTRDEQQQLAEPEPSTAPEPTETEH
jgi:DivIVA domain-containing protein